MSRTIPPPREWLLSIVRWFDSQTGARQGTNPRGVVWLRMLPFLGMHLMCAFVLVVGFSWAAFWVAVALYFARMFAITGFYHRYFSHRTFRTSRAGQFLFAVAGASAVQRGPLWWAAHHRKHHQVSDGPDDVHSPVQHGWFKSHVGWLAVPKNYATNLKLVPDLAKYPELRFLDRFDTLVPVLLAVATFFLGMALETWAPSLGTSAFQMLVWGFFVSTVFLFHGTCCINSVAHLFGSRRYATSDTSRNSFLLSLLTLGEGWHNNHHMFPGTVRQGFRWWEIDVTYYLLKLMSWVGIVWDLRPIPRRAFAAP